MVLWPLGIALAIDALVVVLHLLNALPFPFDHRTKFLDLAHETNLPTWWSSVKLWTAGTLVGVGAVRREHARVLWVAAALLVVLSIDESARLHERLAAITLSEAMPITGVWPLVLGPVLGLAGIAIAVGGWRWWRQEPRAAALLGSGLGILIAAAAGLELLVNQVEPDTFAALMQVTLEEGGELLGGSLMLAGAYELVANSSGPVRKVIA